ncbi:PREDICTED: nardilysin-like [Tarenaya hassleriana]|uniref:nardilysin-like n=1 Tax=Tarenaya hassleriana TaxID=28532 RepID=UPI00053C85F8|nr:PREDICTED: nardilysin-like [Tarenaya hassleriana]XP_010520804.1 PREDICTED: nardilysin-like [Tarenaya hassleriana]XP_010520805.1 PREDICTED: nardilysin-like [Tarenaya hassleriana]XP_010520806.1 PREDICTED: nardilysin-like [Tarenaya hassleriana]XP_010520807.1 PREDICTED: nardilysin-like [Tarenaya hassleriana]
MMMMKSPNRSQRTRGLRTKSVFQAFLLIVLCIWLLYEVKHSYSVKREDVEGNEEASEVAMLHGIEVRLGRKNLDPRESSRLQVKGHESAEEEEMVKQEEGEAEDPEQSVEDLIDEDDDGEKGNEIEDSATVDLDDQAGDEGERNFPEAWEENYKSTDGSSSAED